MLLVDRTSGHTLAADVESPSTHRERRRGLLGRESLASGGAMCFQKCRQVHTFGMRFPIDVMFLDREGSVLRVVHSLPPGRLSPLVWRSRLAVELPAGTCRASGTVTGHFIELQNP